MLTLYIALARLYLQNDRLNQAIKLLSVIVIMQIPKAKVRVIQLLLAKVILIYLIYLFICLLFN